MRPHIVVIGAGPGGLAAAMLLARQDVDVTVVERAAQVGGRTALIRGGGFTFDTGPTFFLYPQILREIFAECGFDLAREINLIRLDPQYRVQFATGERIDATPDAARMMAQIAAISPTDAPNFPAFMAENRAKLAAFSPVFQRPFAAMLDFLSPEVLRALPLLRPFSSVDRDLRGHFRDARIRLAFSFQAKYLGMSPYRCPSLFTILPFMEYEYGVFHPEGGCGSVMETMARLAQRMGVRIRLNEPVEEVLVEHGRAAGVRTAAGVLRADAVVINADFANAMRRLLPDRHRRRWSDRKLARKRFSCSTFMLYLGLEGDVPELPHHTIFLTEDYRGNFQDIEDSRRLTDQPSFYVQNPSGTDRSLAPPGCSALYVLVPVPSRSADIDWRNPAPYRARVLAWLTAQGIPDIARRIRFERIITPLDWEAQGIHLGATFNLRHSFDQMLHKRPHNRFEDLDGVYLVGGGTHPGSGLPVIFESARISTRLLRDDLQLQPRPVPLRRPQPAPDLMATEAE